jgi:hydroxymethylpyrimidine/phosphomethylpyrimidine kinase
MEVILTIAGSDSGAGAGIQQDLKTVTALGHYCATVVTAVTAQNTMGVLGVMPVGKDMLAAQLRAVLSDYAIGAIKIGMIPNKECAEAIVEALHDVACPVVCDPVMISTSGTQLMSDDCIEYVSEALFPLCTLVTPNIPEAERLCLPHGAKGRYSVLLKGGHADGCDMTDILITAEGEKHTFTSPRIETTNLHGTGCTLSSAIATYLAEGQSLSDAVRFGKDVINRGINGGKDLHIGKGNGPLWLGKV